MLGFIKGLVGSKPKAAEPVVEAEATPAPAPQKPSAYFLDTDEAKSFGNLDYMRTAKAIKRSFPKTGVDRATSAEKEFEMVIEANALAKKIERSDVKEVAVAPQPVVESPVTFVTNGASTERRTADSSMDLFRSMVKDIKKAK